MSSEDCFDMRSKVIALLRNELPVLRAKARVSQEDIANKIGISRQTYSSIETGKREMSWATFLALIAFFSKYGKYKTNAKQYRRPFTRIGEYSRP